MPINVGDLIINLLPHLHAVVNSSCAGQIIYEIHKRSFSLYIAFQQKPSNSKPNGSSSESDFQLRD